ncbi:2-amino-4-hydroxy-6-hydroxymethyldihydropteridine diphosphokinase [Pseudofulvibacter geojedonensis]|uniref:2-amino-4-hydroxy-6-hydroxymethyldihydropteridine pyrophosphokinase n=1 Tax=Pseudofulvibacter geojedonensis TaxID=1123758 RepID=A0ABW3I635_9FLAO
MNLLQKIFLSLGTNQGNRLQNLQLAVDKIFEQVGNVIQVSPVYETPSWGFESDDFLNCCIEITSFLSPEELLIKFQQIEIELGRKEKTTSGYQARVIDIDILFINDKVVRTNKLSIPHKDIDKRNFVLTPLADIAKEFKHPVTEKTVLALKEACLDTDLPIKLSECLNNPPNDFNLSKYNFIAIEGNIGCGKTSLATMISQDFKAKLILERFADNAFLPKFYEDQQRFAFPLEMSFLADRYQQLSDDIAQYDLFADFMVSDYHISKSLTFAKVTLPEDEFGLYRKFFNVIYKDMQQPDLYVYLYQNTERLLQNIKKRGREYEQNIQPEYLEKLNKGYVEFMKSQPKLNVKVIDVSDLDFVKSREDYLKVLIQLLG